MSCINSFGNINETFIIEPLLVVDDTLTACTGVYTNQIYSCSGNTSISLGSGLIILSGNVLTNSFTANTINATTYLSGGTNLLDIFASTSTKLTGGTFNSNTKTLTLVNSDGTNAIVTGFTDYYTTGVTYQNNAFIFTTNSGYVYSASFNTVTGLTVNGDLIVTGNTVMNAVSANTLFLSAVTNPLTISGLTLGSDSNVLTIDANGIVHTTTISAITASSATNAATGGTYSTGTISLSGTGVLGTITGLTKYFISATTPTGIVINNGDRWFNTTTGVELVYISDNDSSQWVQCNNALVSTNASATTISDAYLSLSGGTVSGATLFTGGLSANTFSATTYLNLPKDIFVTGGTYNVGTILFTNNSGGTFTVTGLSTSTATQFTGGTVSGATIFTAGLSANTISATTYLNLPKDIFVTGGTYNAGTITLTNNSGGTFTVTGLSTSTATQFTGGTVSGATIFTAGLTANTISATTYFNLPQDIFVTGVTYNNNAFTFTNNSGGTFNVLFNTLTGLTTNTLNVTGNTRLAGLTANTISATTYVNLPQDIFVTGGTYNAGTITLTNNSGGTFTVTGLSTSTATQFTGGTVSGATIFTAGLSANTISATTYFNLPQDIFVTGSTYSSNTFTFTNNSGGTFNVLFNTVTGLTANNLTVTGDTKLAGLTANTISATTYLNLPNTSGDYLALSGGTVTGATIFNSGLSANTISATTYLNLPQEIFVTGATYGSNTFIFTNSSGGSFNVLFNTVTGLTANSLTVTGNTSLQTLSASTISATTYLNLPDIVTGNYLPLSGGTVTGATLFNSGLSANTFSATTYLNLPKDIFVTAATYSNNTFTFTNNSGGTFDVLFNTVTGLTADSLTVTGNTKLAGLTATTVSATTYLNLPSTSGEYLPLSGGTVTGATLFNANLSANTFSATTYFNLPRDIFVTGATYNNNTFTFTNNSGGTFDVLFNTVTGLTANSLTVTGNTRLAGLTASTISATTYLNLPSTLTGDYLALSGGTVTGATLFNAGLSANTISATTYLNLPSTLTGDYLALSGGTVSGGTLFNSGLSANSLTVTGDTRLSGLTATTISATTYLNLPNTLYTGNGSLSGNRVVDIDGYSLNFSGSTAANNLYLSGGSIGVGTQSVSASAIVEISSTTKGFLPPRMTEAQRLAISSPATGLMVYQTDADEGLFIYKSFGWVQII